MADEMSILLFGDQFVEGHTYLHTQLLAGRASPLLLLFLQKANLALRREIANLSPLDRERIPAFSTIEELAERSSSREIHGGVESALLCISQLASYIE